MIHPFFPFGVVGTVDRFLWGFGHLYCKKNAFMYIIFIPRANQSGRRRNIFPGRVPKTKRKCGRQYQGAGCKGGVLYVQ